MTINKHLQSKTDETVCLQNAGPWGDESWKRRACVGTHTELQVIVAQGRLLAGELPQTPSYITKEDVSAGTKCQNWTHKSNQYSRNHLCKLDPRRKADRKIQGEQDMVGIVCSDNSGAKRGEAKR